MDQCVSPWYIVNASKVPRYGVFSFPYFPEFRPEITAYLDTFLAVSHTYISPFFLFNELVEKPQLFLNTKNHHTYTQYFEPFVRPF